MIPLWLENWRALNAKRATIAKTRAGRELALIGVQKRKAKVITNALELRKQLGLPEWPGIGGK